MSEAPSKEDKVAYGETLVDARKLQASGRCCGRKPIVYKRDPHLFCDRCDRAYHSETGDQIANWAYLAAGPGKFALRHPHMLEKAKR